VNPAKKSNRPVLQAATFTTIAAVVSISNVPHGWLVACAFAVLSFVICIQGRKLPRSYIARASLVVLVVMDVALVVQSTWG